MRTLCYDSDGDGKCDQCTARMSSVLRGRTCPEAMRDRGLPVLSIASIENSRPCRERVKLGDLAADFLASLGITPERYAAAKAVAGLEPQCNCDERKEWLNRVGDTLGVNDVLAKWQAWRRSG